MNHVQKHKEHRQTKLFKHLQKETNADRQKPECKLPTGSDEVSLNVQKYMEFLGCLGNAT